MLTCGCLLAVNIVLCSQPTFAHARTHIPHPHPRTRTRTHTHTHTHLPVYSQAQPNVRHRGVRACPVLHPVEGRLHSVVRPDDGGVAERPSAQQPNHGYTNLTPSHPFQFVPSVLPFLAFLPCHCNDNKSAFTHSRAPNATAPVFTVFVRRRLTPSSSSS